MADRTSIEHRRRWSILWTAVALVLGVLALSTLAVQVEVTDGGTGATRACGSAFDALVDRSGWEVWWAGDLDEPDDEVRSALVRTTRCPDAVNARIVVSAVVGIAAVLAALAAVALRRRDVRRPTASAARARARLGRLGRVTTVAGTILTFAGILAVTLLVADADSTLFLYTDRFVVAVVGLIVLVPTIALIVIGRVVTIAADADDGPGERGDRPPDDTSGGPTDAT